MQNSLARRALCQCLWKLIGFEIRTQSGGEIVSLSWVISLRRVSPKADVKY